VRSGDFVENPPGEVEMVNRIFAFSPDPLPPDLGATYDLLTENGDSMYTVGQLSDLDTWLDLPESF
jgi:hypothetical protein